MNISVTADGSLLSPTGGVNTIHPAPEIHEHFMIQKATEHCVQLHAQSQQRGAQCDQLREQHNAHRRVHRAALSTLRAVFRCVALMCSHRHIGSRASQCLFHLIHGHSHAHWCLSVLFLLSFYFLPKFLFHLFLLLAMVPNDSMNNPLCHSAIGSIVTFDYCTPDTDMAPWLPMLESTGSKRGQTYMSACGEKLPNLGQKQLKVWTNEGKLKICDQGNRCLRRSRWFHREPERSAHKFQEGEQRVRSGDARERAGRPEVGFCLVEQVRKGHPPGELVRPIYTSTSGGVERVTDEQTDKEEEQAGADELDEALDPLRRRVCRQPTQLRFDSICRLTNFPIREWCPECIAGAVMTIHIAHDPLKFESFWWSLRCTGITVSRATKTEISMLSCWLEETKRQG